MKLFALIIGLSSVFLAGHAVSSENHRVFAEKSFWYQPIPKDAPLHPNSAAFVEEFLRQKRTYYGTVGINTTSYASPVYVVSAIQPRQRVTFWDCQNKGYVDPGIAKQWEAVPIPDDAQPAKGTDAELTIYQPSTDRMWEFWQLRRVEGDWQACWGGMMTRVSENPGIWVRPYGTTATGLPFMGGQISLDDLRRGRIDHAMGIALVETEKAEILSWPATRSDGVNPSNAPNRIPQGLRFRLDPDVDVEALDMHPVGKMIARAAQTHGFIVWDKAGAVVLRAENPLPYMKGGKLNPYAQFFGKTPPYAILSGFPWERLQFLPMNYGRP